MNNPSLPRSGKWLTRLCSIAVALVALFALPVITSAQVDSGAVCAEILEQSIECRTNVNGQNHYQWCFTFRNHTKQTITQVTNGTSSTSTQVAPGGTGRVCLTIVGNPGMTAVTLQFCRVVVTDSARNSNGGRVDSAMTRVECCMQRITVRLPECEPSDSTDICAEILEQSIECRTNINGQNHYEWCFTFRNRTNETITQVTNGTSSVSTQVPPGGTGRVCLAVIGNQGMTAVTLQFCRRIVVGDSTDDGNGGRIDTAYTRVVCCTQRVILRLPDCEPKECIRLSEQEIFCDSAGQGRYLWCFSFLNNGDFSISSIGVGNQMYSVGYVPPGTSGRICLPLNGTPGPTTVVVRACYSIDSLGRNDTMNIEGMRCCEVRVELRLPECEPVHRDCCDGFIINFANATPVAAPNGLTGLIGLVGAGPNPISKVSATIVSASVNGQPGFAYFNSGTILNPLGTGTVTPPPFGQELIWNSAAGVQMNGPSFFLNWLRLPSMAPNARRDTVSFCIRWRFTDVNCRTCDTLVCYRVVRNQFFFNTGARSDREKGNSVLGGEGEVHGQLKGQSNATLSISFPTLPAADFGNVTFTGITIQADENVRIGNVASAFAGANFSAQHGIASGKFTATPGQQIDLNISYDNLNGRAALGHFLMISYESSLMPGVEQQIPLSVTLRQEGTATGGDRIEAVSVDVESREIVQTFALHLRNANNTAEALSGLRITAGDGVKLLAVGPTSSETEALLRFGAEGEGGRPYISEAAEGTMALSPGSERNPIYVTLAMNEEADPVIRYSTLNGLDETVSEGELNLSQISSVGHDRGGVAGTGLSLGQSAPNPTTGQVAISMRLTAPERVSLTVRDVNGREVMRLLQDAQLTSGTHVVTADVSALPSGTYFYTLESASGTETRRMTVAK